MTILHADGTGDIATWVGSIGTSAAFLVAAIAYVHSGWDRRRAQARLVGANLTSSVDKLGADRVFQPNTTASAYPTCFQAVFLEEGDWMVTRDSLWFAVTFANRSDETVTDVRMSAEVDGTEARIHLPGIIESPPRHEFEFDVVVKDPDPANMFERPRVTVQFTDAAGRIWQRTTGEPLQRLRQYAIRPTQEVRESGVGRRAEVEARPNRPCPTCGAATFVSATLRGRELSAWCSDPDCPWTRVWLP